MELTLPDGTKISDPDAARIRAALAGLDDGFAILSRTEATYIQAAGDSRRGFVVEYQEGSLEEHFHSAEKSLPIERVVDVFARYAASDATWRTALEWKRQDLARTGCLVACAILALGVAASCWA